MAFLRVSITVHSGISAGKGLRVPLKLSYKEQNMRERLKVLADECGGTALDYAVLASLILCVCVVAISAVGRTNSDKWDTAAIAIGGDGINPSGPNCSPMNPGNC